MVNSDPIMKSEVFLAGSVRTPLGSFCSAFADVSAVELGVTAVKAAVERAGIPATDINEVIIGNIEWWFEAQCRPADYHRRRTRQWCSGNHD